MYYQYNYIAIESYVTIPVVDLIPGQLYRFKVAAVNTECSSDFSEESDAIMTSPSSIL